ncbi:hypothetical protein SLEP1_g16877 [Rubroshorea leprosula]|uniref:Uncharacterized protein n=1 Tax=Rubroshorea leprosula TaxID=152421 RepID=A0AAV5IW38_9ROSI|nr:hypothetical protein SLEP1_g16877 [Rubroshorea leprosula]
MVVGLQEVPRNNISRLLQSVLLQTHVLLGKVIMQSLHLYVFGPTNSELFIKAKSYKIDEKLKHSGDGSLILRARKRFKTIKATVGLLRTTVEQQVEEKTTTKRDNCVEKG